MPNPKAPVIHLGYPKTATTLLQKHFFDVHPDLAGRTILGARGDAALTDAFRTLLEAEDADFEQEMARLHETFLQAPDARRPVISHEHLCLGHHWRLAENWTQDAAKPTVTHSYVDRDRVIQRLAQLAPEATLLVTVRSQVPLLESLYLQLCGNPKFRMTYEAFLEDIWAGRGYASILTALDYDRLAARLSLAFPRDRIVFLPYEWLRVAPSMFAEVLGETCGVSPADTETYIGQTHANPRATNVRHTLRRIKRALPMGTAISKTLPRPVKSVLLSKGTPQHVTTPQAWRSALTAHFAPGNRHLSAAYGLSLEELGYPV